MPRKEKLLTCTFHIGGQQVETLTDEQRKRIGEKISKAMSLYYTAHPDEFLKL